MAKVNKSSNTASHVTFFPGSNVDYVKVAKDIDSSMAKAVSERNVMKINTVLMTKFAEGTVTASYFATEESGKSTFTIYKKTPYQKYYQYVCTLSDDYELTDYNIVSNQFYHYLITVEIPNGAAGGGSEYLFYENTDITGEENYYYVKFDSWTICDVEVSEDDDKVYIKSGRLWELGLNLENEDLTVNRGVTSWDTLGKYPKISIGQKQYQSMSFTSLLGKMMEYDAYSFENEEGITVGTSSPTFSYTEKLETYNTTAIDNELTQKDERWGIWDTYARENDKLLAWNEFINNGSLKLLRDLKGNAWIIQVSESTSYNINTVSALQQTAVSFQWKEVVDASNKSVVLFGNNTEV